MIVDFNKNSASLDSIFFFYFNECIFNNRIQIKIQDTNKITKKKLRQILD
jgi:hypothetical protein